MDYEIELEYEKKFPDDIVNELFQHAIDFKSEIKGKNSRFIDRYSKIVR